MQLQIGQTISHYRIAGTIGRGGMGEVYVAEDTKLSRRVALKILPAEMAGDADRRGRFERARPSSRTRPSEASHRLSPSNRRSLRPTRRSSTSC